MRRKIVAIILIFIEISLLWVSISHADNESDKYYNVGGFKFDKSNLEDAKNKATHQKIIDKIQEVKVEELDYQEVITFSNVLGAFHKGAYRNITDDKIKKTVDEKIINGIKKGTTTGRLAKQAEGLKSNNASSYGAAGSDPKNDILDGIISKCKNNYGVVPPSSSAAGQNSGQNSGGNDIIYNNPEHEGNPTTSVSSIEDVVSDAEKFMGAKTGANIHPLGTNATTSLSNFSKTISGILLAVGIAASVIVGGILGIQFMTGSIDAKAKVKELLIPYIVGCVVIFGAFVIWQLMVTLLGEI